MAVTEHEVVIAGAGPTGLMLAGELALAGVDAVIVERRLTQDFPGTRARGLHSRTIEVFDQRGIADRFLSQGRTAQVAAFARTVLDISDFPTRHPYGLALVQNRVEEILAGWVEELKVPVLRGQQIAGFTDGGNGVDIDITGGEPLRAKYLAGCDGGRSLIRKTAGIDFPGWDPSVSSLIAEVEMTEEPQAGIRYDANGTQAMSRLEDGKRVGVVITEPYTGQTDEPTLEDLRRALIAVWGTDFGAHNPTSLSRFTDMTRQAATYRKGRVLLAGDAAHIHYPVGGQGLNLGVQDAVNLGWKLAQVVRKTSPDSLLDTYHAERHPVAARVLQTTMAQTPLTRSEPRIDAVRTTLSELLRMDQPRKVFGGLMAGLDIRYDLGDGHPLVGRRMPDLDIAAAGGLLRVFSLLHRAWPALINFGAPGSLDIAPWADRVPLVDARYDGRWELPVIGDVAAPGAVLVRPDGYVAWVGGGTDAGLKQALTHWFGPPDRSGAKAAILPAQP